MPYRTINQPFAQANPLKEDASIKLPTPFGELLMNLYLDPKTNKEHIALIKGNVAKTENIVVRVHSECLTGDLFGSKRCDCGPQLEHGLTSISESTSGILIYLRQEGRGIGLLEKMRAYSLQDLGYDTVQANELLGHKADARDYEVAARILKGLDVASIQLITNNPEKVTDLSSRGIKVTARLSSPIAVSLENKKYLETKSQKLRHIFNLKQS